MMFLSAVLLALATPVAAQAGPTETGQRKMFEEAWSSARAGRRERFEELGPSLENYVLYPYWQYEDYRHRRGQVAPKTMSDFLAEHEDWAFSPGLRVAWLRTLGKNARWQALLTYGAGQSNTEVRCYYARARLATGDLDGLLAEVRTLWAVGKSQPDACDSLFQWLIDQDGITPELAWERIRLAMRAGNPRLTIYLARFLPPTDRAWLERWQKLNANRYRGLAQTRGWHDGPLPAMITAESLERLAHHDAGAAMKAFDALDGHFSWSAENRGEVMREIALMAAVALEDDALEFGLRVPAAHRNEQLVQWTVRAALARNDWARVLSALDELPPESGDDDRWLYWRARAQLELGDGDAGTAVLDELSGRTSFFGFLAADHLTAPYTICPREPEVSAAEIAELAAQPDFQRALELRQVDMDNWAISEWSRAAARLRTDRLKVAAGLALRENWHDRAIFALGDSGELQFYEWRFPILYQGQVMASASQHDLDPAWMLGVMRSESAMTERAKSSAGAMGLMQVTPATAKSISRKHGLPYRGSSQLLQGDVNIRFGSVYLRELLDDHDQNPVLVMGAYNAGPNAVKRWLANRSVDDASIWMETLPYYETRDYIPRVLAFSTLYDWRLENPVRRVSSRMPGIESGNMTGNSTTQVVCAVTPEGVVAAGP